MAGITGIFSKSKLPKMDTYILGVFITLCVVSVVESYSASSREIATSGSIIAPTLKHIFLLGLGSLVMLIVSRIHYNKILIPSIFFSIVTVICLLYSMFFSSNINGAQRVIHLPGFTLQPAEMAKIAVVFVLAFLLALFIDRKEGRVQSKGVYWCVFIVSGFGLLLIMNGMTNTLLFMCTSVAMMIIGGTQAKKFFKIFALYAVVGLALMWVKSCINENNLDDLDKQSVVEQTTENDSKRAELRDKVWTARIATYFSRFSSPLYEEEIKVGENDQEIYSHMAQANGGVIGVMPGNSRECSRLPLAFSDYVFAIVVEDLGFVGGTALILLYFSLLIRAGNVARNCNGAYPAFLVMGMAVMIVLQAFFHTAIVTGVFPVSGQQLPLISRGGTAIILTGLAFGVMLSVSRFGPEDVKSSKTNTSLPENMRAANPTFDSRGSIGK